MKIVGNLGWRKQQIGGGEKRERERGSIEFAWNQEVSYCSEESMDSAYSSCV